MVQLSGADQVVK